VPLGVAHALPVTVAQFARFVDEAGYLTLAERPPNPAAYPDADPPFCARGRSCFIPRPARWR